MFIIFNPATTPIYNVTWRRVDNTTLEFTCGLACRTPAITGCNVNLIDTSNDRNTLFSFSAISSHFVTVIVNNVNPTAEYSYTAIPQAIVDGVFISLNGIQGIIPATIQGTYILFALCVCVYIYILYSIIGCLWWCINLIYTTN